jgi:hypothetical protein
MRVGSSVAERDIDLCIQQPEVAREGQKNLAENVAVSSGKQRCRKPNVFSLRGLFGPNKPAPSYEGLVDRCLRENALRAGVEVV